MKEYRITDVDNKYLGIVRVAKNREDARRIAVRRYNKRIVHVTEILK